MRIPDVSRLDGGFSPRFPKPDGLDALAKARAESTPETERSEDCRRFLRLGGALKKLGPSSRARLLRELGLHGPGAHR